MGVAMWDNWATMSPGCLLSTGDGWVETGYRLPVDSRVGHTARSAPSRPSNHSQPGVSTPNSVTQPNTDSGHTEREGLLTVIILFIYLSFWLVQSSPSPKHPLKSLGTFVPFRYICIALVLAFSSPVTVNETGGRSKCMCTYTKHKDEQTYR